MSKLSGQHMRCKILPSRPGPPYPSLHLIWPSILHSDDLQWMYNASNNTKVNPNKNQMTLCAFDWYHLVYDVCAVVKLAMWVIDARTVHYSMDWLGTAYHPINMLVPMSDTHDKDMGWSVRGSLPWSQNQEITSDMIQTETNTTLQTMMEQLSLNLCKTYS